MKKTIALTTVEQAQKYHRYMWRWLARHPEREKHKWPGFRVVERPKHHCFACWVGVSRHGERNKCHGCPILVWRRQDCYFVPCLCGENNTYGQWRKAMNKFDYDVASGLAMIIAEYKWSLEKK